MITKMKERLEQFLAAENITQAAFADKINVTRSSITHILSGRNKPGYDFFAGLIKNYPSLNMEWLLTGRGRMYKSPENSAGTVRAPLDTVFPSPYAGGTLFSEDERTELRENVPETEDRARELPEDTGDSPAKPDTTPPGPETAPRRKAEKIIIFYDDGTYEEFRK